MLHTYGSHVTVHGWFVASVAFVLGTLLAGRWVVLVFGGRIDRTAFATVLVRCLDAGNATRALKLAQSAPGAPLAEAVRAALVACRDRSVIAVAEHSDYRRGAIDDSPDAVATRVRDAYERGFRHAMAPIARARWFAPFAAVLFCVPLFVTPFMSETHGPLFPIAAGVALVVLVATARGDRGLHVDRSALFDTLESALYETARSPERFEREASATPASRSTAPAPAGAAWLTVAIYEPGQELRTEHIERDIVKIGRLATAHVKLESPGVSRMHAVIERGTEGATIIDLGNEGGTWVNGERVTKRVLRDGDVVTIGEAELRVGLGDRVLQG